MFVNIASNKVKLQYIVIGIMLLLSILSGSGYISQTILSLGIVLCCAYLFIEDKLIYALPFIIFYNDFYGLVFGLSVLRIFTFMLIFRAIFKMFNECKIRWQYMIPIVVYLLFFTFVISGQSIRRSVFGMLDIVCCSILAIGIINDEKEYKNLFRIYTFVAMVAFVSGLLAGNFEMEGSEYTMEIPRFNSTFEDSNYMGFFYNIAIFSNVTLDLFKPRLKVLMIIVLEIMMLASLSMTAIVVNIALWLIYLILTKKIGIKSIILIAVVGVIALGAYSYGLENPDAPILGALSYRINDKLENSDDIDAVTTNRTKLSEMNFKYFMNSPVYKQLFGGTSVNPVYLDPNIRAASHNEYIDLLLNVGIVGFLIMISFVLWRTWDIWCHYKATKSEMYLSIFMSKATWFIYALALTMFTDYRFLFFFMM